MLKTIHLKTLIVSLILLTLIACGGGSESSKQIEPPENIELPENIAPTVVISTNLSEITESDSINLNAIASDTDGTIETIQWTSNIGSFSNPNELETLYTAPEVIEGDEISITLEVTDNLNSSNSSTLKLKLLKQPITVSGRATYENVTVDEYGHDYSNIHDLPIRGASVYLLDMDNNIISQSATDSLGLYSLEVAQKGNYSIEIVAEIGSSIFEDNYISVRDNLTGSNENRFTHETKVYRFEVIDFITIEQSMLNIDFAAELLWDSAIGQYSSGRNAPIFALLDQAYSMQELVFNWRENFKLPPLTIYWNENNIAQGGVWWNGEIPNSSFAGFDYNAIFVRSDDEVNIDEYDRTLIGHELGHFVLVSLSRDESLGGSHSATRAMDMRQSFIEGFASYFSWLLTGNEFLIDSDGKKNGTTNQQNIFLNVNNIYNKGWYYENVNSDILKTIAVGNDSYHLPGQGSQFVFDVIHDYMNQSDAFISIHSFIGNSIKKDNSFSSEFQAYLLTKGVSSLSEWGTNETYNDSDPISKNALEHTYLPLYTDIKINDTGIACLNDTVVGSGNRLGIVKYFRFTSEIESDGGYFLNWNSNEGPSFIWSWNANQTADIAGASSSALSGTNEIDMRIGTQIIGVSFYGNSFPGADITAPPVETGCITFSITN